MKKILVVLIILLAMYATAKWPNQVVSVMEVGYRVVKAAVSQGAATIKESRSSNAEPEGAIEDAVEL